MIQYWRQVINQLLYFRPSGLTHFLILFLLIFAVSCKNSESDLGINLRPDKGEIYSAETDTFTVNAYTVNEDSIKTDALSSNILGAMYDPEFGISTAGIAVEATIVQSNISFGTLPNVDSVLLYIRLDKSYSYGNINSTQNIKIYTLSEKIDGSKKYYSNYSPVLGTQIGTWSGIFNTTDSITLQYGKTIVKQGPGLLIKLEKTFGELLANANPSVYSGIPEFKEFLKGIVLVPEKTGLIGGQGAILGVDLVTGNSQFMVHYNDSSYHSFIFNNTCKYFNIYSIQHTNPDLLNQLANPGKHYNKTYVQSMGGCKTKIEIPYLLNLVNNAVNERIIINEAALVFTPQNGSVSTNYSLPIRLSLFQPYKVNQDTTIIDFIDYLDPTMGPYSLYGGGYNSLTGEYTIRFTRHLQYLVDQFIINKQDLNRGFYLTIPSDKPITPTRLILDNTRLPNYKALKFRVTYSKIKT